LVREGRVILDSHILALVVVAAVVAVAAAAYQVRSLVGRRAVLAGAPGTGRGEPYVLYFTGPNCTICKTHQEPALSRLEGVSIEKIDAIERQDLAERFHVYTVPTTVVIAPDGKPQAVNYGYAPAEKLKRQLAAIA
jgi:thiol-disulfide isomerase/thioredoxin